MVALRDFLKLVRPQCLFFDDGEGLIHIFFSAVGNEPQRCCGVSFTHETNGLDAGGKVWGDVHVGLLAEYRSRNYDILSGRERKLVP